jgi:hypothetical protein
MLKLHNHQAVREDIGRSGPPGRAVRTGRAGAPDPLRQLGLRSQGYSGEGGSFSEASRPEIVYCEQCYNAEVA